MNNFVDISLVANLNNLPGVVSCQGTFKLCPFNFTTHNNSKTTEGGGGTKKTKGPLQHLQQH